MSAVKKIAKLLKYLHKNIDKEIDIYDKDLQKLIGVDQKQLSRYFIELSEIYENIRIIKKGRKNYYKLVKPIDVINEAFNNSLELSMLFEMAKEQMPEVIEDWHKISKESNKPFLFFNMPYEDVDNLQKNGYFNDLKNAIINQEYRDIYVDGIYYKDVKPFKLVFSDGNWYIAFLYNENLVIRRVNFIKELKKSDKTFKLKNVNSYLNWFEKCYQNSFSQYNQTPKKAILLAKPNIGRYFKKGIKKHFKSKEVIKEYADGSVKFSLKYTHSLEILPFIQKWIPDLIVLEPKELKNEYIKKLKDCLDNHISTF